MNLQGTSPSLVVWFPCTSLIWCRSFLLTNPTPGNSITAKSIAEAKWSLRTAQVSALLVQIILALASAAVESAVLIRFQTDGCWGYQTSIWLVMALVPAARFARHVQWQALSCRQCSGPDLAPLSRNFILSAQWGSSRLNAHRAHRPMGESVIFPGLAPSLPGLPRCMGMAGPSGEGQPPGRVSGSCCTSGLCCRGSGGFSTLHPFWLLLGKDLGFGLWVNGWTERGGVQADLKGSTAAMRLRSQAVSD